MDELLQCCPMGVYGTDTASARPGVRSTTMVSVRCHVCGTIQVATMAEAEKRAEKHARVTRHTVIIEMTA